MLVKHSNGREQSRPFLAATVIRNYRARICLDNHQYSTDRLAGHHYRCAVVLHGEFPLSRYTSCHLTARDVDNHCGSGAYRGFLAARSIRLAADQCPDGVSGSHTRYFSTGVAKGIRANRAWWTVIPQTSAG